MPRFSLRLALLLSVTVVLATACMGSTSATVRPSITPTPTSLDFRRVVGVRTAAFRNTSPIEMRIQSSSITETTGYETNIVEECAGRNIAPFGRCSATIRLTQDIGGNGRF